MKVIKPGLLTTVQDSGRLGLQHLGVVPGGAMDPVALLLANALVGNERDAAALEITVLGPELQLESDALIALCGAEFEARAGGKPLPMNRPVLLRKGVVLACGRAVRGSRAYLAAAGGIAVPPVLGSRSTFLPARFGGLAGRALRAGDSIPLAADAASVALKRYLKISDGKKAGPGGVSTVRWTAPSPTLPQTFADHERVVVHALEGRHYAQFDAASRRAFFEETWKVSPDSNRMGFRLAGSVLARPEAVDIPSEPTCLGTVQVPASGLPIALMADHQTTGGYPKIAEIAGADVPRLAQLAPGGSVQFARCTMEDALALRRALRQRLDSTLRSLKWEFGA
jgi:antagonist of KipI